MRSGLTPPVLLRGVCDADHDALRTLRADIELQHLLLANPPADGDLDISRWIERRQNDGKIWVVATSDNSCAGYVQLDSIHTKNRYAHLGVALIADARGLGYGRAAMQALIQQGRSMGLRKLLLHVRIDNASAIALYEGLGFRRVGSLSAHYDDGSRTYDVLIMELMLEGG